MLELRAITAEKAADEATMRAEGLARDVNILQLQTQLAIEQLRAVGVDFELPPLQVKVPTHRPPSSWTAVANPKFTVNWTKSALQISY